jgi:hypothetical protein
VKCDFLAELFCKDEQIFGYTAWEFSGGSRVTCWLNTGSIFVKDGAADGCVRACRKKLRSELYQKIFLPNRAV